MKREDDVRIIIDTNLWISFLIGRKLSRLLDMLSYPEFQLVISDELIGEICDVFSRPKLTKYYTSENIDILLKYMKDFALSFELKNIPPRCRDPKDDYLLELALISDADFLVTGDKDLLDLKEIGKCQIVTATEFDIYASSIGHPTALHEGLEEYYNIVIESRKN